MSTAQSEKDSPIKELNARFVPENLLWCKKRLDFLTTLALEEPDLVRHDSVFPGFRESLIALVLEKIEAGEPPVALQTATKKG